MSRFRMLGAESLRSLTANLSTTIAATMTVLIGMFLLGLCIALGTWVLSWSSHVKKQLVDHVYMCTDLTCSQAATKAQENAVANKLASLPEVKDNGVRFIPKEEALRIMQKKNHQLTSGLTSNPLPDAFEVTPKRGEDVEKIAKALEPPPPGVEKVSYGRKTAKRVLSVAKILWLAFLIAVIVLVSAAALLIANTIRLSIFARRREIEVMKLVGATNWFVRGPFMLEGVICGVVGSLAAVILLLLGKEVALPAILGHVDAGSDVRALAFSLNAAILLLVGLLLGAAGSGMTIRRFLRV